MDEIFGNEVTVFDRYLKDINKMPILKKYDEEKLLERVVSGDKVALDTLIKCNLRFVVSIAKKYADYNCSIEDLVNEGNCGLIIAAHKFDIQKNVKFITYAVWWIRAKILQYKMENGRLIRVPNNKILETNKIKDVVSDLSRKLGRTPTINEIIEDIPEKNADVCNLLNILLGRNELIDDINTDSNVNLSVNSIDEKDTAEFNKYKINLLLSKLNKRQRNILTLYFGLDDDIPKTLNQIGDEIGISRETVRLDKNIAINELKNYCLKNTVEV
jgi:RNA polymerase primary sigma factor